MYILQMKFDLFPIVSIMVEPKWSDTKLSGIPITI